MEAVRTVQGALVVGGRGRPPRAAAEEASDDAEERSGAEAEAAQHVRNIVTLLESGRGTTARVGWAPRGTHPTRSSEPIGPVELRAGS